MLPKKHILYKLCFLYYSWILLSLSCFSHWSTRQLLLRSSGTSQIAPRCYKILSSIPVERDHTRFTVITMWPDPFLTVRKPRKVLPAASLPKIQHTNKQETAPWSPQWILLVVREDRGSIWCKKCEKKQVNNTKQWGKNKKKKKEKAELEAWSTKYFSPCSCHYIQWPFSCNLLLQFPRRSIKVYPFLAIFVVPPLHCISWILNISPEHRRLVSSVTIKSQKD